MKTVVIYKSHYGSTETYARWIAEDLGADLLQAERVKPTDLQQYEVIVYGGGVYVGSVSGLSLLTKNADMLKTKALYLFTVGAADVNDPETSQNIRSRLQQKLPPALWEGAQIYHLRGGMQYSKMRFLHRLMMSVMIKLLQKKPKNELLKSDKYMLETYGLDVVIADRAAIAPLVADIRRTF